ncbi:MAG: hypothetical protein SGJ16_00980 [Nitrospirota bacterium]|nr:hypothetical protein [Nitrospirota bacterium]
MSTHTATPVTTIAKLPGQSDRRHGSRTLALFSLLCSSMDSGQMLIGDGLVTNLIPDGFGIRGNRLVPHSMDMAIFTDLLGMTEPLCIAR